MKKLPIQTMVTAAAFVMMMSAGVQARANDMINNTAYAEIPYLMQDVQNGSEATAEVGSIAVDGDATDNKAFGYAVGGVDQTASNNSKVVARFGSIDAKSAKNNDAEGGVGQYFRQEARNNSEAVVEVGSITADGVAKNNMARADLEFISQRADTKSKAVARLGSIGQR